MWSYSQHFFFIIIFNLGLQTTIHHWNKKRHGGRDLPQPPSKQESKMSVSTPQALSSKSDPKAGNAALRGIFSSSQREKHPKQWVPSKTMGVNTTPGAQASCTHRRSKQFHPWVRRHGRVFTACIFKSDHHISPLMSNYNIYPHLQLNKINS